MAAATVSSVGQCGRCDVSHSMARELIELTSVFRVTGGAEVRPQLRPAIRSVVSAVGSNAGGSLRMASRPRRTTAHYRTSCPGRAGQLVQGQLDTGQDL